MEHNGMPPVLSIDNLADGALYELLSREFERLAENISDVNTSESAKRKIKVEIAATPFKDRSGANYSVSVSSTFPGVTPVESSLYIAKKNNQFFVFPRNHKQQEMEFGMSASAHIPDHTVKPS